MEKSLLPKHFAKTANGHRTYIQIEEDDVKSSQVKLTLLWFDLSGLSKTTQFLVCCVGLFAFYLIYGYLLELMFTLDGLKPYGWYVTLMQFAYYSIFAWTENFLTGGEKRKIPIKTYLLLAALTLGTVGFSNTSLQYLNYPTQVIFKCCKLIPVMLGGILIQKKIFGLLDFLAAISMCIGLAWFTLADSFVSPNFNALGVVMISFALLCDAAIGNVQEKMMNAYNVTSTEVVLYSYSLGFIYLFVLLMLSREFFSGFYFCLHNPIQTYGYGLVFSISGYLGVQIVLTLVKSSGAFAAATVTTCRKAVSIVLSFVFFSKPFTINYFWSGLLVLLGIYLNINAKNNRNVTAKELLSRWLYKLDFLGIFKRWKKKRSTHELTV
ncbi:Adenosine 3'-phospho 5'-phosphosulfate transporter 2 [Polyplax serrata]|uniref:Adenosine 3'-phospho 5'-phosphosulfate transporter 2 n=1 Tax=Polyplax serrata TaxID=468196 RepID=A0ABR1AXD6_POLSC